jgi:hypothetical protein
LEVAMVVEWEVGAAMSDAGRRAGGVGLLAAAMALCGVAGWAGSWALVGVTSAQATLPAWFEELVAPRPALACPGVKGPAGSNSRGGGECQYFKLHEYTGAVQARCRLPVV